MRSLPFYADDLSGGFMKMEGILRVEDEKLYFDFEKKDNFVGAIKSGLKSVEIPLNEIESIDYKKSIFSTKLVFHSKNASTFEHLPGGEMTKRVLKIKKEYRQLASNVYSNLNLKLSELRLRELGED